MEAAFRAYSETFRRFHSLQSAKKGDQIRFLLKGETETESLVVEVNNVIQRCRRTVVEIGGARCETAKDWALNFSNVGAFAGDHSAPDVGDLDGFAGRD